MELTQLSNDKEYALAIERIEDIFDSPMNLKEREEYNKLSLLIEEYELTRFTLNT